MGLSKIRSAAIKYILYACVLGIMITLVCSTYYFYNKTQDLQLNINTLGATVSTLTKQQNTLLTSTQDNTQAIHTATHNISNLTQNFTQYKNEKINDLQSIKTQHTLPTTHLSFQVQMALYEMIFFQDYQRAIFWLTKASEIKSNHVIQNQIQEAIYTLQQINTINIDVTFHTITHIEQLIIDMKDHNKQHAALEDTNPTSWQQKAFTKNIQNFLGSMIKISTHETKTNPTNIEIIQPILQDLNHMKWALMNKFNTLFHESCSNAIHNVQKFASDIDQKNLIMTKLRALQELNLKPKTPNIIAILDNIYRLETKPLEPPTKTSTPMQPNSTNTKDNTDNNISSNAETIEHPPRTPFVTEEF